MPQFVFSTAMTANQLGLNPLSGWQYEYLPWPAAVLILVRSTGVSNRITVFSGSETIQERTRFRAAELLVQRRVSLILPRSRSKPRREIVLSWSSMKSRDLLRRLMESPLSTRSSDDRQMRLDFGTVQRNPGGTV